MGGRESGMIWLYAVTDRPQADMPRVSGIEDARLTTICVDGLAAVVSECSGDAVPRTEENLLRHEAVLEALMGDRTVLPVRFGTVASERKRVREALWERRAWCGTNLARLRGRVELGLRVLWSEPDDARPREACAASAPASGRAYLLARAAEERREKARYEQARDLALRIHGPLERLAVESSYRLLVTPRMLIAGAYLVDREQTDGFRGQVRALGSAHPSLGLLCTGPWPPFSFVAPEPPDEAQEATRDARF
jgi:hypothetical protein